MSVFILATNVKMTTRERTIRLAADTIRFDSMQKNIGRFDTDMIRLRGSVDPKFHVEGVATH